MKKINRLELLASICLLMVPANFYDKVKKKVLKLPEHIQTSFRNILDRIIGSFPNCHKNFLFITKVVMIHFCGKMHNFLI